MSRWLNPAVSVFLFEEVQMITFAAASFRSTFVQRVKGRARFNGQNSIPPRSEEGPISNAARASDVMPMLRKSGNAALLTLSFMLGTAVPGIGAQLSYDKVFFVNQVAVPDPAKAPLISAGAQIQTWSDDPVATSAVNFKTGGPPTNYDHAATRTGSKVINGGLPISPTAQTVLQGYNPGEISLNDGHSAPNKATANIKVDALMPTGPAVDIRIPGQQQTNRVVLNNSVRAEIIGVAEAGPVNDHHGHHSADSFAAVEINGKETFVKTPDPGSVPQVQVFQNTVMQGGAFQKGGLVPRGKVIDPAFMTILDLDTGVVVAREQIMSQTVDWTDALFSLDATGIQLTVNKADPLSSVSLLFLATSPWISNPYSYGATLNGTGLVAFGETPLSGWTLTTDGDIVNAFFAFGAGGQPYDYAQVTPPSSLFTAGHTYQYDVGSGNGVFVLEAEIPEPSTLAMLGIFGLLILAKSGFMKSTIRAA